MITFLVWICVILIPVICFLGGAWLMMTLFCFTVKQYYNCMDWIDIIKNRIDMKRSMSQAQYEKTVGKQARHP